MKIALIRKKLNANGGAENYLVRLMEALLKQGHELHLIATKATHLPAGVNVERVSTLGVFSFLKDLSFALAAKRAVQRGDFDVVFSLDRTLAQDVYRAGDGCHREWMAQKAKTLPFFKRLLQRINPLNLVLLCIEKKLYNPYGNTQIIANSGMVREDIIKHYKVPSERIHRIYNGLDHSHYRPFDRESVAAPLHQNLILHANTTNFIFVGTGFKRKGLTEAIEALSLLNNRLSGCFRLFVLGKDRTSQWQELALARNLKLQVRFLGEVEAPLPYYHLADMLIFPTWYDPFSNACLEAMSAGCPVLTTRHNGVAEIIDNQVNGYVVDEPTDAEAMYEHLVHYLQKADREAMSHAAANTVKHLTIENNAQRTLAVLNQLNT